MNFPKKLKDTYLLIANVDNLVYQTTNLTKWKVFKILIKRDLKDHKTTPSLTDNLWNILFTNLSKTWKTHFLYSTNGREFKYLEISEEISERIWEYIRNINKIKWYNFDCSAFAHFISWAPIRDKGVVLELKEWDYKTINPDKLNPWDIVFIWEIDNKNTNNWNYHWVIYLWEWLFLSKYWDKMNWFVITDLQALIEMEWNEIFNIMKPDFTSDYTQKIEDYIIK